MASETENYILLEAWDHIIGSWFEAGYYSDIDEAKKESDNIDSLKFRISSVITWEV